MKLMTSTAAFLLEIVSWECYIWTITSSRDWTQTVLEAWDSCEDCTFPITKSQTLAEVLSGQFQGKKIPFFTVCCLPRFPIKTLIFLYVFEKDEKKIQNWYLLRPKLHIWKWWRYMHVRFLTTAPSLLKKQ